MAKQKSDNPKNDPAKIAKNRRTFGLYIFSSIVCLLIITVAAIVGYIWYQYSKSLTEISNQQMRQATEMVSEKVINYLTPASVMAKLSSELMKEGSFDPRTATSDRKSEQMPNNKVNLKPLTTLNKLEVEPNAPDHAPGPQGVLSRTDDDLLQAYGSHLLESFPQLAMANIADEQGNFMMPKKIPGGKIATKIIKRSVTPATVTWKYSDKPEEVSHDVRYDPRTRPWYKGAKKSKKSYWTDVYIFFSDQAPGITTAYPLFSPKNEVIGVFSLDIALAELSMFLQQLKIGKTGVAYIINQKNQMIAYPEPSRIVKTGEDGKLRPAYVHEVGIDWVAASFDAYEKTGADRFEFESNEKTYLGAFTNLGGDFGKDWKIAVVVPEEDFLGPLIHMRRVVILISLIVMIISVFIARLISQGISRPILSLTEETKKIENFELDGEVEMTSSIKEIQMMTNSISSMKMGLRAFEKYVPSTLVRQLIQAGEEAKLGGKKVELTILFSDIQGFTNISETVSPEILMVQLFEYNNALTNIIKDQEGTIDKYIGDAIMAFWGAPTLNENHALMACEAALLCHRKVEELNKKWEKEKKPLFVTRFGLHSGQTIVGNMGSDERMNYSVLGDSVNLASRIEGVNKQYGTNLIITEATYEKVKDHFMVRPLDNVAVKGKKLGVKIYEVLGKKEEVLPEETLRLRDEFSKGFDAYLKQEWDKAMNIFTNISKAFPSDDAAKLYVKRCSEYKKNPPGKNWDKIYRLTSK